VFHFHGMFLPFVIVYLSLPLMVSSSSSHQFFLDTSSYILNTCEPNEFVWALPYVERLCSMPKTATHGTMPPSWHTFPLTNIQFNPTLNCLTYHTINPWHFPYFKSIKEIPSFKVKLLKIYLFHHHLEVLLAIECKIINLPHFSMAHHHKTWSCKKVNAT